MSEYNLFLEKQAKEHIAEVKGRIREEIPYLKDIMEKETDADRQARIGQLIEGLETMLNVNPTLDEYLYKDYVLRAGIFKWSLTEPDTVLINSVLSEEGAEEPKTYKVLKA